MREPNALFQDCSLTVHRLVVMVAALLGLYGQRVSGQAFPIFNGNSSTCTGALLDSGGQGGAGYGNNENFTYTLCPDAPGGAISLDFITFNLSTAGAAPIDGMTIHDGDNTGAPVLGTWTGTGLQGQVVSASAANGSGCLTVVFASNGNGTGIFAAAITCYQPCARPTAVATHGAVGPQQICPGESVTFNSSASFAAPGFSIASRRWEFGDGTVLNNAGPVVSHTYAQPGGYTAQLHLLDNNGCASTNRVDLQVLVGTEPNFQGTGGDLLGCAGETLCIDGVVNGTTWNELPETDLGGGVFLPDNVGQCFTSELTFTQFLPGQTLTNVNDLLSICMEIEHSFIGDLVISIISPNGQSVVMHQQGGGGTFLGEPIDNDLTPNAQGVCYTYCFSPTATNGTWVDNAGGTLPEGTYESLDPLNGLVGSPLNGTWTIEVCDLWASDNGFICNWGIDFNPALYDDLITFTPVYGAGCDSSAWSGPHVSSTSANCNTLCVTPPGPGNYTYTYTATDNFGCTYDTTLTVTIVPGPTVNAGPDASTCNTPVQLGASANGGFPTNCIYTLNLFDSFGDGWTGIIGSNGSQVTITVNGISSSWTLAGGAFGSVAIPVQQGDVISLSYTAGSIYNGEQSYSLVNGSGTVVYASPTGPASGFAWSGTISCPGGSFIYSWSPATGLSDPNIPNPIATVAGTTTYCVTVYQAGHPDCVSTDCMTITVDNAVDPGTSAVISACASAPAIDLFTSLGGTPTAGGTWTAPGGAAHSGSFVPGADVPGIYTYTVGGAGACGGATVSSTVTVNVSPVADAGTSSSLSVCANSGTSALFSALGGTPQAGGSWSGPGGAHSGTFNPAVDAPGIYTYTVAGVAPCPPATATVSVTVSQPVDAGVDNGIVLCTSSGPVALLGLLGGTPDGTGSWTDPNGVAIPGGIDPATALPGDYTYTVLGTAPCPNDAATLSIAINTPPDPGTNSSTTLCSTDAAVDLFTLLGGTPDAGGVWSGPSALAGSSFDPATMNAGVYTYTVAGVAPCPAESATVTLVVNTPPDPGTNVSTTLCSTDAAVDLFTLLGGTPDAGGVWSGPSALAGSSFDPATMNAGVYTYTVAGVAPCPAESATVTVVVNTPPDPGTDGSTTLCSTDAAVDLFTLLGGTPDAGGVWSGPSALAGSSFDPATMNAGVYTYTVAGVAPCPAESATVTVVVNTPPDPGTDGSTTLCSTDAAVDLFTLLGGTPDAGGVWSGPSALAGSSFDPATMNAGVYTYTVAGVAPCPAESATVTVVVNTPPDPGTDGSTTLCSTDAAVDLFTLLGGTPDAGGVWSGPSALAGSSFDPATMNAGVYTYTVAGVAPCPAESATVTVVVNTPPNAGLDGAIALCSSSPATALASGLAGTFDPGGIWTGPGGAVVGPTFTPGVSVVGTYVYTVAGLAPCPADEASVLVSVLIDADAGTPGTITLCSTDAPIDLFAQLGGTPDAGGAWSGPSAVVGGAYDPATMAPGVYTYTITVPPPCVSVSSTVTVTEVAPPNAGSDGSLTLCISSPATALFPALGGAPQAGGVWSGPSAVVGGLFNPATMNAGSYTYTVAGATPCPADAAVVIVTVVDEPDAGTPGTITLCSTDAPIDLFAQLGGTPDAGGAWSGPSAVVGGAYDPATMTPGVYTYTITVPPPCVSVSSTVTVTEVAPPNAGTDGSLTLCISSPATALLPALGGAPQAGGVWSGPSAVVAGLFNPAIMSAGSYTYTVVGSTPCPADAAVVTVTVVDEPDAGTPGTITLCSTDAPINLFAELGGTPDAGGAWSGPSAVVGGAYDPATMAPGVYTYTITVPPPCVPVSSTVTVTVITPPNAGTDGALALCVSGDAVPLSSGLNGFPDLGGSWTGPSPVVGGEFDPATMTPGMYTYTVSGTTPCPADAAMVEVTVVDQPFAGGPGFLTVCSTGMLEDLITRLEGTPDIGGTWTTPSGTVFDGIYDPQTMLGGSYTYSINVPPPCISTSATVQVEVIDPPVAGTDGSATFCSSDEASELFPSLGGSPQLGGVWSTPTGGAWTGTFDPSMDEAGEYLYIVAGTMPCPADTAVVNVALVQPPDPGTDDIVNLCITGGPVDLFPFLGSADDGGTWAAPGGSIFSGVFDPTTNASGDYSYTVSGMVPCPALNAVITVQVLSNADAGNDGAITLCQLPDQISLFGLLGGTPDAGGIWSGPDASTHSGLLDPSEALAGTYRYIVEVPLPCLNDTAEVQVGLEAPVDAGSDGSVTLCSDGAAVDLFDQLNGDPDSGGTWSYGDGTVDGLFDPSNEPQGTYTYTVFAAGVCPDASAAVLATVHPLPVAGTDGSSTVCPEAPAFALFPLLGGTPDVGGSWTAPDGSTFNGIFDPATDTPGMYTYTVSGTEPCPNADASATVAIHVVPQPDAGPNVVSCTLDGTVLALGTWSSGMWSGDAGLSFGDQSSAGTTVSVSNGGQYTAVWSTISNEGCAASDSVQLTFTNAVVPAVTVTNAICNGACDGTASVMAIGGNVLNGDYSYQWSIVGSSDIATLEGLCAGTYSVAVADTNGCAANASFTITEPVPLQIDQLFDVDETCPGTCDGRIVVIDGAGVLFSMDGANYQPTNQFTGLCPGAYTVWMQNADGCIASAPASIGSPPPVVAGFIHGPDTLFIDASVATFTNTSSSNATSFIWDFGTGDASTATSPTYAFPGGLGGSYTVCLTAMDVNGCADSVCTIIPVFDRLLVFVPNAFTPNGDGFNEGFRPVFNLPFVVDYEFMIFDRWGERIFTSQTLDEAWDGTYGGGVVETEVYVWKLTCRDQLSGELIERIGHVTVLQ
ncbi:MAG: PKD domain-containing protein [Flavobacteriales bacterium]